MSWPRHTYARFLSYLYKTRHPNESHRLFTPRWKLSGGCPPGQLYEGPKVDCTSQIFQHRSALCTSSDRCGLKYIPVPSRLTSPRRTISHRPRAQIAGYKRTDLVKDTQFCLQVNDGTLRAEHALRTNTCVQMDLYCPHAYVTGL
jgi:hypothetical protein